MTTQTPDAVRDAEGVIASAIRDIQSHISDKDQRIQFLESALTTVFVNLRRAPEKAPAVAIFASAVIRGASLQEAVAQAETVGDPSSIVEVLAALDSRAVMNAASDLCDFADRVMEAAASCCTDPDAGPSSETSVSFTGEEGARIANDLHRMLNSRTGDAGEAVAWCSPGQLANLTDVDRDAGVYLPIRKTKRGNFTMPLFASTAASGDAGEGDRYTHGYAQGQTDAAQLHQWMQDKAWQDTVLMLVHYQTLAERTWLVGHEEAAAKLAEWWRHARVLSETKSVEGIAATPAPAVDAVPAGEVERTLAAGRIIDIMTGGKFDWRSRLEDSDFLESADWLTALAYADAALSHGKGRK